jgi:tetratricopeptide (TPR) repeat protein
MEEAELCYTSALKIDASNPKVYKKLGGLNDMKKNFTEAAKLYTTAFNLDKNDKDSLFKLGWSNYRDEKQDGLRQMREAIKHDGMTAENYAKLGEILMRDTDD